ncbi:MFS transporter [Vulgatibacter incomptus]|uniref:MFS transporter n=1 Tax=Vulgatibacter incomptus TaxID=1391653 RepID=A0A0K1PC39_9BACT|nr:MFS transporter [Vulgatibacter incomptus]AKU91098.1 hypothetical protein AKJ08_1485 [Vulgatibacter incomptus]
MEDRLADPIPAAPPIAPGDPPTEDSAGGDTDRTKRSLAYCTAEGMTAEVVTACAGGATLIAWALYLQCSPVLVAILGSLPFLAQIVQLPSALLTSRLGGRRVAIVAFTASRLSLLPLVVIPFLGAELDTKRDLLFAVAAANTLLAVVGTNAWTSWVGELVPATMRCRYFGMRSALTTLSGASVALLAGIVIQRSELLGLEPIALSGLAAVAIVAGLATAPMLRRQHEPEGARPDENGCLRLAAAASCVLRDPASKRLLAYQVAWNAAIGISSSFFALHLLTNLRMGFALVAAQAAATALVRTMATPVWGRALDRLGPKRVLVFCSFGLFVTPLVWLSPSPSVLLWVIALDALTAGTLWAGHSLSAFELPLAIAPREKRPYYLATFAAAGGLAFAAAALFGGVLAQLLPDTLFLLGKPVQNLQVLFVLSAIGRLMSAPLALRVLDPRKPAGAIA